MSSQGHFRTSDVEPKGLSARIAMRRTAGDGEDAFDAAVLVQLLHALDGVALAVQQGSAPPADLP